jgi:hypothetical protein
MVMWAAGGSEVDGGDGEGDRSDGMGEIGVDVRVRLWGGWFGEVSDGRGDGGNKDYGVVNVP